MDRIDKILSHHGFGSRKDVKKLLRDEQVFVNGKVIYDPGFQLDISKDVVLVSGQKIKLQKDLYIMMNKCRNVVCANRDGEHSTVFDLLDESLRHNFLGGELHCMGRLDIDTEGLLILTTDGKLTHRLLSPKNHAPKTYAVALRDSLTLEQKQNYEAKFLKGFWIDHEGNEPGFNAQPAKIQFKKSSEETFSRDSNYNLFQKNLFPENMPSVDKKIDCLLTIYEGKFHQVKRMFSQLGNEVVYLKRVKMGDLELDYSLEPGSYRELTAQEVALLG